MGYPMGALQSSFKPPSLRLRVEVDGEVVNDFDQPVLMVAVGNGTSVGGGAELTPEADAEDGVVDVMISRATGPLAKFATPPSSPAAPTTSATTSSTCAATRCRWRARSSSPRPTASSTAPNGPGRGTSRRRRTP